MAGKPNIKEMYTLKPCPFCGGEAKLETSHRAFINAQTTRVAFVFCKNCNARSGRVALKDYGHSSFSLEANDEAVSRWNTRKEN